MAGDDQPQISLTAWLVMTQFNLEVDRSESLIQGSLSYNLIRKVVHRMFKIQISSI